MERLRYTPTLCDIVICTLGDFHGVRRSLSFVDVHAFPSVRRRTTPAESDATCRGLFGEDHFISGKADRFRLRNIFV